MRSGDPTQDWLRYKRRSKWRYAVWLALAVLPAALLALFLPGWLLAVHVILPAPIVAAVALLAAIGLVGLVVWQRRRALDVAGLDQDTLVALDMLRGSAHAESGFANYWRGRLHDVMGDRWGVAMVLAVVFALGLNTMHLWLPLFGVLVGQPFEFVQQSDRAVVQIDSMRVVSPLDGQITDHSSSDGYLQVHEGAEIAWLVTPLVPATYVTLYYGDTHLTLSGEPDGHYAFQTVATVPTSYRFEAGRWGVAVTERLPRRIEVLPDLPPEPMWLEKPPEQHETDSLIRFSWRASDDRGVTGVVLEIVGESNTVHLQLNSFAPATALTDQYQNRLDPAELPVGKQVTLTLLAYDNDQYGGPNIGRSDPVSIRLESVEADHDEWQTSLVSYLRRQTRHLGKSLDHSYAAEIWQQYRRQHSGEVEELAATARDLSHIAQRLPLRSIDATDALLGIARLYDAVARADRDIGADIDDIEEATWRTDELIGAEEAARLEHQENQVINRLEQIAEDITAATDSELERMLRALEREMAEIARSTQSKRPQMPTELLQKEAFRAEKQSERADLMQQIREAIQAGDRERAQELMQQMLEMMRQAREQAGQAAESWAGERTSEQELRSRAQALEELRDRQQAVAEQMDAAQAEKNQAASTLQQELKRQMDPQKPGSQGEKALQAMEQALRQGDLEGAGQALEQAPGDARGKLGQLLEVAEENERGVGQLHRAQGELAAETAKLQAQLDDGRSGSAVIAEAMEQARGKMDSAQSALDDHKPGEGANQGRQAADQLDRAAQAAQQQLEQVQRQRREGGQFAEYGRDQRPGRDGDYPSDEFRGNEDFETPDANNEQSRGRDEVLQGFRRGLPDPGRAVNKRYLDRLLH